MEKRVGNVRWGAILVVGIFCFLFMLGRIEQIKAPYTGVSETAKTTGTPVA
jgi:hypothetical protein